MLYDRSYMKKPYGGKSRSLIDKLIISLLVCFVIQLVVSMGSLQELHKGFLPSYLGYSSQALVDLFIWTPLTFTFFHDGPLSLIISLLGIHFMGRAIEHDIGSRNFIWTCFASALSGSTFWLIFHVGHPQPLMGATTLVMSFITLFCLRNPNRPISLLLLPIALKPRIVFLSLLGLELFGFVFYELRGNPSVNYSAHLGGMMAGAFVFWFMRTGRQFPSIVFRGRGPTRSAALKPSSGYAVDLSDQRALQEEVDRILDKINDKGFGSLSQKEKNTLDKAKGLLHRR